MGPSTGQEPPIKAIERAHIWFALILLIVGVFVLRLFFLQVIRYDYYHKAALSDQLKQYQIPATRGIIEAHQGGAVVPFVLNQKLYTVYADPTLIKYADKDADMLQTVLGGAASKYHDQLTTKDTRYVVLAKKVSQDTERKILAYKDPGIGAQEQDYRSYPDSSLASQTLGFVNNDGNGVYGLEQALNQTLAGTPGELKAVTDINGVPLAANSGNILQAPKNGSNVVLTLDLGMQQQMEQILQTEMGKIKAKQVSAVIIDPNTGAIKAIANNPTFDPTNYQDVSDPTLFQNAAVTNPIEVGSIMKTLTTSAALDQGVIQPNTTYYDPASWTVDGFKITNIEEDGGPGTKSIAQLLNLSLNTGATWELMQMGGGQINQKARDEWHTYMVDHFQLGKTTNIEQGYESAGYVPGPKDNGAGIDLTYANTAFGQAMTATAVQMAAGLSSVLNGGTYYQPHLVDQTIGPDGSVKTTQPVVVKKNVVGSQVGPDLIPLMEYVVQQHGLGVSYLHFPSNYIVGGKTGTAQIAKPGGTYYDNEFNGTYLGFVGGDKVQYVIAVFTIQPKVAGYAGTAAAQPIFADLAHMLINNFGVTPKSH